MRFALIVLLAAFSGAATAAPQWGLGFGMESRLDREVNPDYADVHSAPQLYGKIDLAPWAFVVETSQQSSESGEGSLHVSSQTQILATWARYEFPIPSHWMPFVSMGAGMAFDQVTTTFAGSRDVRNGNRGLLGAGGGLTGTFFSWLQVEAEGRVNFIEDHKDPDLSALLRLGVLL